jgi:hypothetical protein
VDKKEIFLAVQAKMVEGLADLLPEHRRKIFIDFYVKHFAEHFRNLLEWIEKNRWQR